VGDVLALHSQPLLGAPPKPAGAPAPLVRPMSTAMVDVAN
jgi:hypothetical protein